MNRRLAAALLAAAFAPGLALALNGTIDARFRGAWVPARAACDSPLRMEIGASSVSFVNGTQRVDFNKLEQCFSCMGQGVENVVLLSTEAMGDSPWTATLDARRRQPALSVDFSNDKRLGVRFPLGSGALKKCG